MNNPQNYYRYERMTYRDAPSNRETRVAPDSIFIVSNKINNEFVYPEIVPGTLIPRHFSDHLQAETLDRDN